MVANTPIVSIPNTHLSNPTNSSSSPSVLTPPQGNIDSNKTPSNTYSQVIDTLPSQTSLTPNGQTPSGQKVFKLNNRITDYVCENIVQAYDYPSLIVTDNPLSSAFHDDISALMMFRGLEKDEMNLGQTYEEYKKH